MPKKKLSELFGEERLTYDELMIKASEAGLELGDIGDLKRGYEEKLDSVRKSSALERALDNAGVRNRSLVSKIIDMSSVQSDEDGVHGITEQLDALRESDPYLFEKEAENVHRPVETGMSHSRETRNADSLSDDEYYRFRGIGV